MNPTLHALLPKKLLSMTMYKLSRIRHPWLAQPAIKLFMKATGANLDDALRSEPKAYDSLLDFFTRELAPETRPIAEAAQAVACPVDGAVAHVGDIVSDQIFQVKGHSYSLTDLVGEDYAENYQSGQAATIYLAPYDYHRIHAPLSGTLKRATYIPGELNSVSISLLTHIAGLFAKNERLVLEFETDDGWPYLMVLVGAVNVGSIETVFHGQVSPHFMHKPLSLPTDNERVEKGQEIGRFNLGSTIIFITPKRCLSWQLSDRQKTQMGQQIAELL